MNRPISRRLALPSLKKGRRAAEPAEVIGRRRRRNFYGAPP